MVIDAYGYPVNHALFLRGQKGVADKIVDGTTTYLRYSKEDIGPIWKIEEAVDGSVTIRWGYGSWADYSNVTYDHDTNQPMNV